VEGAAGAAAGGATQRGFTKPSAGGRTDGGDEGAAGACAGAGPGMYSREARQAPWDALADIAFTLQTSRTAVAGPTVAVVVPCDSFAAAAAALRAAPMPGDTPPTPMRHGWRRLGGIGASGARSGGATVALMFPGHLGGGGCDGEANADTNHTSWRALYGDEPIFRQHANVALASLAPLLGPEVAGIFRGRVDVGERKKNNTSRAELPYWSLVNDSAIATFAGQYGGDFTQLGLFFCSFWFQSYNPKRDDLVPSV